MPETNKKLVSPLSKPELGKVTDGQPFEHWSSLNVLKVLSLNGGGGDIMEARCGEA